MAEKIKKALIWIICKTLPTCKNVTEMASRSLETELGWRERLMMKLHLWSCVACHRYLAQIKFMSKVFEIQEDNFKQKPTPVLSSEAVERLKKKIKSSQYLLIFALINLF